MTLEEIKNQITTHTQQFQEVAEELSAILSHNVEAISLTDAQDLASEIRNAVDYIESAINTFERIGATDLDGPEEDEE